jgi:type VI secretion system protein ImpG
MDPRLIDYYNQELNYLRELVAEFTAQFPKVAARLGIHGVEVEDPYVERLMEGFSFLAAHTQLDLDAEFPHFSKKLLESIYPNCLAQTPAMCVVQFSPKDMISSQGDNFLIPHGEPLKVSNFYLKQSDCQFRTAHEVDLWPMQLTEAKFEGIPTDFKYVKSIYLKPIRFALRLQFAFSIPPSGKVPLFDKLSLYINGDIQITSQLYELLRVHTQGLLVRPQGSSDWQRLGNDALYPQGFSEEDALLPKTQPGFEGYRLLHEYFAFPQRFHFMAIHGLRKVLSVAEKLTGFEIVILLDHVPRELERSVDAKNFALFCTPAINLFTLDAVKIPVLDSRVEIQVVPDMHSPLDYEVYHIEAVESLDEDQNVETRFRPFYSSAADARNHHIAWFSTRRESRLPIDQPRKRTTYAGSETFISLLDSSGVPLVDDLTELHLRIAVTNRDLPFQIMVDNKSDYSIADSIPAKGVTILAGPTKPMSAVTDGPLIWQLINHLGFNYNMLADSDKNLQALRELLSLYTAFGDPAVVRQAEAIIQTRIKPIVRLLPLNMRPITHGRGVGIDITIDEDRMAGISPYLFGAVLQRFFARHVRQYTFTEMQLMSKQRGLIARWPPQFGLRPVV